MSCQWDKIPVFGSNMLIKWRFESDSRQNISHFNHLSLQFSKLSKKVFDQIHFRKSEWSRFKIYKFWVLQKVEILALNFCHNKKEKRKFEFSLKQKVDNKFNLKRGTQLVQAQDVVVWVTYWCVGIVNWVAAFKSIKLN